MKGNDLAGIGVAPPHSKLESSTGSVAIGGHPGVNALNSIPRGSPSFPLCRHPCWVESAASCKHACPLTLPCPTGLADEDSSWVFLWILSYDRFLFLSPHTGTSTSLAHNPYILFKPNPPIYRSRHNYLVSFWLWVSCCGGSTSTFQMLAGPQILGLLEKN